MNHFPLSGIKSTHYYDLTRKLYSVKVTITTPLEIKKEFLL